MHRRKKHDYALLVKRYIDGSGICPACKLNLRERHRVVAHVSDSRRPMCRDTILSSGAPPLDPSKFEELEELYRTQVREAKKRGRSHPEAHGSAVRADGKRVGRVRA